MINLRKYLEIILLLSHRFFIRKIKNNTVKKVYGLVYHTYQKTAISHRKLDSGNQILYNKIKIGSLNDEKCFGHDLAWFYTKNPEIGMAI
jgi:hypothetical protein